jgi:hypothetical protein
MTCENGRALGCIPASASEQSLKVDIYRTAQSQLFHTLTTLKFNACNNMDMIDDILVRSMYDFDGIYDFRSA